MAIATLVWQRLGAVQRTLRRCAGPENGFGGCGSLPCFFRVLFVRDKTWPAHMCDQFKSLGTSWCFLGFCHVKNAHFGMVYFCSEQCCIKECNIPWDLKPIPRLLVFTRILIFCGLGSKPKLVPHWHSGKGSHPNHTFNITVFHINMFYCPALIVHLYQWSSSNLNRSIF